MSDKKQRKRSEKSNWRDYLGIVLFVGIPAVLYILAGGGAESFYRGP